MVDNTKAFHVDESFKLSVNESEYKVCLVDDLLVSAGKDLSCGNSKIKSKKKGVYIFVLTADYKLNYRQFFSEVTGCFMKDEKPYLQTVSVPPFLLHEKGINTYTLLANHVLYVGRSEEIRSRIWEHLSSSKINRTTSLKLGFSSRKKIKEFLRVYVIYEESDRKGLESAIRVKYGCYFGE